MGTSGTSVFKYFEGKNLIHHSILGNRNSVGVVVV